MTETFETVTFEPIDAEAFSLDPDVRVIVAGYTGRDEAQVRHHIEELAAIGVAPPAEVPMVYPMPTGLLTTATEFPIAGDNTSGEVEPVYIRHHGQWYLGVGSDHTDRTLETVDIGDSKRACPKPVGQQVTRITDWAGFDFDACQAASTVDGVVYQGGSLSGLRRPEALIDVLVGRDPSLVSGDLVVFGGTLPLLHGTFVAGAVWTLGITLPEGIELTHTYAVTGEN